MSIEKFYVKKDSEDEFEISEKVPGIEAMGITKIAPQLTPQVHQIVGSDGEFDYGSFYAPTTMKAKFYLAGSDVYDYKLLVSALNRALYSRNLIRVHDEVEPSIVYYVHVKPFAITPINFSNGVAEVEFINPSGFRQSIVNSDQISGYNQVGMNLPDKPITYQFTTNSFQVYNPSDVTIDPYMNNHQFKMTLRCNGTPTITNQTTNTEIAITSQISTDHTYVLNGVDSYLDSNAYGINTDLGYLTLAKGWNDINITGATNISVIFSFPFLYL